MDETFDLREIMTILLKGKWIIVICIAICLIISLVFSWFLATESYTSTATVQVINVNSDKANENDILSNYIEAEFIPTVYMQRLTKEAASIGKVSATNTPNTNLISLTSNATTAENAQQQLEQTIEQTSKVLQSSIVKMISDTNNIYLQETKKLSVEIEQLMQQYNKIITSKNLPNVLLLEAVLSEGITLNITDDQLEKSTNITGSVQNDLLQLKTQIETKTVEYEKHLSNYQSMKTGLDSFQIEQYVRTIVEPGLPSAPSSPNKPINVAIGLLLGLMVGIGLVFFRAYWKATVK